MILTIHPKSDGYVFLNEKMFHEFLRIWAYERNFPEDLICKFKTTVFPLAMVSEAINAYFAKNWERCAQNCYSFFQFQAILPPSFLAFMTDALKRANRLYLLAWPLLHLAEHHLNHHRYEESLEAFQQIFYEANDKKMTEEPLFIKRFIRLLEKIHSKIGKRSSLSSHGNHQGPILFITPFLDDHHPLYSFSFLRNCMEPAIPIHIWSTEETHYQRPKKLSVNTMSSPPSTDLAPILCAWLHKKQIPFSTAEPKELLHTFKNTLQLISSLHPSLVIYLGGIENPLHYLIIRSFPKLPSLCITEHYPLYAKGILQTFQIHPHCLDRDRQLWHRAWGEIALLQNEDYSLPCNLPYRDWINRLLSVMKKECSILTREAMVIPS